MSTPRKIVLLWNEYLVLNGMSDKESENAIERNGKKYKHVKASDAPWTDNIF